MNYLNQSTNQNDGLAGRCQGLFRPQLQRQGKAPWGRGWLILLFTKLKENRNTSWA